MSENFSGGMEEGQAETRAWITFLRACKWKEKIETAIL